MNGKVQINPLPILIPFEKEIPILVFTKSQFKIKNCIKSVNWLHLDLHILVRIKKDTDNLQQWKLQEEINIKRTGLLRFTVQFQMHKTIDHQGILKLKKNNTVL